MQPMCALHFAQARATQARMIHDLHNCPHGTDCVYRLALSLAFWALCVSWVWCLLRWLAECC